MTDDNMPLENTQKNCFIGGTAKMRIFDIFDIFGRIFWAFFAFF